jgi:N-acetyl-gamma-glutamyl-phosphate reductase
MVRVGIVGATGYAGAELVRLVVGHPNMELARVTSGKEAGERIDALYPGLVGTCDAVLVAPDAADLAASCDLVFLAVPHTAALALAPQLTAAGVKVVDLSADYRLADPAVYEAWYAPHTSPDLLAQAVYCIPELNRADVAALAARPAAAPRLVANPGCYPTATTLAAAPALRAGLVAPGATVVVDAISGVSGAGKGCNARTHYCSADENVEAYGVAKHRHTPEIEQNFARLAGAPVPVLFTPHLAPLKRGLLSTVYLPLAQGVAEADVRAAYEGAYVGERFVHVLPQGQQPRTASVAGSNRAQVAAVVDGRTNVLVATCAIDNLGKGAAGQAVQNANLLCGLPEQEGLWVPAPLV